MTDRMMLYVWQCMPSVFESRSSHSQDPPHPNSMRESLRFVNEKKNILYNISLLRKYNNTT